METKKVFYRAYRLGNALMLSSTVGFWLSSFTMYSYGYGNEGLHSVLFDTAFRAFQILLWAIGAIGVLLIAITFSHQLRLKLDGLKSSTIES